MKFKVGDRIRVNAMGITTLAEGGKSLLDVSKVGQDQLNRNADLVCSHTHVVTELHNPIRFDNEKVYEVRTELSNEEGEASGTKTFENYIMDEQCFDLVVEDPMFCTRCSEEKFNGAVVGYNFVDCAHLEVNENLIQSHCTKFNELLTVPSGLKGPMNGQPLRCSKCVREEKEKTMTKKEETTVAPWEVQTDSFGSENHKDLIPIKVLVDGDIVAYRVAAAADGRHYTIAGVVEKHKHQGKIVLQKFKYKKEASKYADQHSIAAKDITLAFDPENEDSVERSLYSMMETMKFDYKERGYEPEMFTFLTGVENFRNAIYPDYKCSRVDVRRPHHLAFAKQYLVEKYGAIAAAGYEADDLIAMATTKILKSDPVSPSGESKVSIASIDKDFIQLGCIGVEFFDFTNKSVASVSRFDAWKYFYKQLLTGDKSDDIPGIKGVGPQTAIKLLKDCKTEEDMCTEVLKAYQSHLDLSDEKTVERVKMIGSLLHLVREHNVMWEMPVACI